jgi:pyruvate dehydrogenase E2 component (dihydrolipoamide acetyltransferase)
MPKLSPTMEEGQLTRWLKKEGDKVSMGEPLAEIDTDKATMEMQALSNGVLRKILIQEGESAPLGQPIAIIGEADEDISELEKTAASAKPATAPEEAPAKTPAETPAETPAKTDAPPEQLPESDAAPAVAAKPTEPAKTSTPPSDGQPGSASTGRVFISPIAARMASDAGIDFKTIQGSGPGGRIVKRDIETAMSEKKAAPAKSAVGKLSLPPRGEKGAVYGPSAYRDEPASEMRRTIARRLVTSLGPIPHFFLTSEIDMERAAETRGSINERYPDLKLSINDLIIKVAAVSLIQHPQVNASFQDKTIRYYEQADIGVAVATENGLITPIIRAADVKSLLDIGGEVRELADRARARKLKPEEYTGATFSISNLGMFGIEEFTAVINPPEGAILAVGAMAPKAVARDGQVAVRQTMRVTLSCDHRVIDGATGARFLQTFKQIMENPLYLFLD